MKFFQKYRRWIIAAAVIVLGIVLVLIYQANKPVPTNTDFITDTYSFNYPRTYATEEYAPGVVSIGNTTPTGFNPLVEVVVYQSDPQSALPKNFDVFVKQQSSALCGSDNSLESISCKQGNIAPYTSPKGLVGQKMNLTMIRKNLKTGTTTSATYGPFYVFNTSPAVPSAAAVKAQDDKPFRYSGVFVYPSFTAFLEGTTSPMLLNQVVNSLTIPKQK